MIDSLDRADVEAQVSEALRRGDRRLLGVQGYHLILPGIPEEQYHRLKDRLGVRILPYTSDAVHAGDHDAYNQAAARYAYHYNRELLRRLGAGYASTWVQSTYVADDERTVQRSLRSPSTGAIAAEFWR